MKSPRLLCSMMIMAAASMLFAVGAKAQTAQASQTSQATTSSQSDASALTPQQIHDLVWTTIKTEIDYDTNDHSVHIYHVHYTEPGKDQYSIKFDTPHGTLARITKLNGQEIPLSVQAQKVQDYINDPSLQAKKRRSSQHDDEQSAEMLKMLPNAFIWTVKSQTPQEITLSYRPDPNFDPPNMQDRVFAAMAGEMVIDREQHRIKVFRGELIHDVTFGWGILGRMYKGGTFEVIRQQLSPHVWAITQTHIHINGHILFFKQINENEDEVDSDFQPAPPGLTLEEAYHDLIKLPNWPN